MRIAGRGFEAPSYPANLTSVIPIRPTIFSRTRAYGTGRLFAPMAYSTTYRHRLPPASRNVDTHMRVNFPCRQRSGGAMDRIDGFNSGLLAGSNLPCRLSPRHGIRGSRLGRNRLLDNTGSRPHRFGSKLFLPVVLKIFYLSNTRSGLLTRQTLSWRVDEASGPLAGSGEKPCRGYPPSIRGMKNTSAPGGTS